MANNVEPKAKELLHPSWIDGLEVMPVPIQASLERLSSLLTTEWFFSPDEAIEVG